MRCTRVHALGLILLALVVVAAAGCGGGKKNAAATVAAGATTSATTHAAATQASTSGSSLSGLASAKNCSQLTELGRQFSQALTGSAAGDTKKVAQLLQQFAAKTPSDIRADFEVVAAAYAKLADAVGNVTTGATPDATALAKLQKLAGEIDQPKLTKAWQHISTWAKTNCRS